MYTETFDDCRKDKQAKICSETTDGSRSGKNSNPEVIDRSGSSIGSERQIDFFTIDESDKSNYSDTHINGTKSISASARRSSSSSSSKSSSFDFFGMDTLKFTKSGASTVSSKSGKNYVYSSESSPKSEVGNSPPVPTSTYDVYNSVLNQNDISPTVSPPIQVMDRSGGYDDSRIPSSVFERNSSPMEWSIASNDSLFSIHIGQNSFSRQNSLMIGGLGIPGELTKSGELSLFSRTPSVIVEEIDTARKSVDLESMQTTETSDEASKLEERFSEDQNEIKTSSQATSCKLSKSNVSSLSNRSGASTQSFAFPIKKRSRPFFYCSNCSLAFCYNISPTCCHTWPSSKCSNFGWSFCYCWNYSRTNASPILTEVERTSSEKTDTPRQQSYKEESEASSNSTSSCCCCFQSKQASEVTYNSSANCCNWFHCFSCPSCTCKPSCTGCKCCC